MLLYQSSGFSINHFIPLLSTLSIDPVVDVRIKLSSILNDLAYRLYSSIPEQISQIISILSNDSSSTVNQPSTVIQDKISSTEFLCQINSTKFLQEEAKRVFFQDRQRSFQLLQEQSKKKSLQISVKQIPKKASRRNIKKNRSPSSKSKIQLPPLKTSKSHNSLKINLRKKQMSNIKRSFFARKARSKFEKALLKATYGGDSDAPKRKHVYTVIKTLKRQDHQTDPETAFQLMIQRLLDPHWASVLKTEILFHQGVANSNDFSAKVSSLDITLQDFHDPSEKAGPHNGIIKIYWKYIRTCAINRALGETVQTVSEEQQKDYAEQLENQRLLEELGGLAEQMEKMSIMGPCFVRALDTLNKKVVRETWLYVMWDSAGLLKGASIVSQVMLRKYLFQGKQFADIGCQYYTKMCQYSSKIKKMVEQSGQYGMQAYDVPSFQAFSETYIKELNKFLTSPEIQKGVQIPPELNLTPQQLQLQKKMLETYQKRNQEQAEAKTEQQQKKKSYNQDLLLIFDSLPDPVQSSPQKQIEPEVPVIQNPMIPNMISPMPMMGNAMMPNGMMVTGLNTIPVNHMMVPGMNMMVPNMVAQQPPVNSDPFAQIQVSQYNSHNPFAPSNLTPINQSNLQNPFAAPQVAFYQHPPSPSSNPFAELSSSQNVPVSPSHSNNPFEQDMGNQNPFGPSVEVPSSHSNNPFEEFIQQMEKVRGVQRSKSD